MPIITNLSSSKLTISIEKNRKILRNVILTKSNPSEPINLEEYNAALVELLALERKRIISITGKPKPEDPSYGIVGTAANYTALLTVPTDNLSEGDIYYVEEADGPNPEGYYRLTEGSWALFIQPKAEDIITDVSTFNNILSANDTTIQKALNTIDGINNIPLAVNFAALPATPTLNKLAYYVPFQEVVRWDGNHWVGKPETHYIFGRFGGMSSSFWCYGVAFTSIFPSGGNVHGVLLPEFLPASEYKIYKLFGSSAINLSGDLELHDSSNLAVPNYGATGIAKTTFINQKVKNGDVTPAIIPGDAILQCFFRRTGGTASSFHVGLTIARVAK